MAIIAARTRPVVKGVTIGIFIGCPAGAGPADTCVAGRTIVQVVAAGTIRLVGVGAVAGARVAGSGQVTLV